MIVDESDIYGDGVNVAARLEGLAEPGGICVARTVYNHVRNKIENLDYEPGGDHKVKNIAEPISVYRVLLEPCGDSSNARVRRALRRMSARWPLAAAVATILLAAGIVGWLQPWRGAEEVGPRREPASADLATVHGPLLDRHRIAVLPFANISADAEDEYFSDGMTEELISQLSKIAELSVVARTSVMTYKGAGKGIDEIGRELGVGTVLEGSVRKAGDQLRITAQLIDVSSQTHLWSEDYDRRFEDVFAIQSDIAQRVAQALEITLLAGERAQIARRETHDLEAYNLYLRGLYFWNQQTKDGLYKAKTYWDQALDKDPAYAVAQARLAEFHLSIRWHADVPAKEAYQSARAAAEKALMLDDQLAEAHTALAYVKLHADWDWPAAERALKRAIALNPSYVRALELYGHRLLLPIRRQDDEAIAVLRRAVELDPLSQSANEHLGWALYHAQRFDEAAIQFGKTLELYPDTTWPHVGLGQIYIFKGRHEEGVAEIQKAVDLSDGYSYMLGYLGWAYGRAGRKEEARQVLETLRERAKTEPIAPFAFVWVHLGLGDREQVLAWLDQAYDVRDMNMIMLQLPEFKDSLAPDPRYERLLTRMGLTN